MYYYYSDETGHVMSTKSFKKLYNFLKLHAYNVNNFKYCVKIVFGEKSEVIFGNTSIDKFDNIIKNILERSLNIINESDIKIESFYIGLEKNIMEAIIIGPTFSINTEKVEWPMDLNKNQLYIYIWFRYLTGVITTVHPSKVLE